MLGQGYFERRLGDIFPLSAVPYLSGTGELQKDKFVIPVRWEVNVAVTGESVFAVTSEKIIPPSAWVNSDRSFAAWTLTGRTADGCSSVKGEGVTPYNSHAPPGRDCR